MAFKRKYLLAGFCTPTGFTSDLGGKLTTIAALPAGGTPPADVGTI